VTATVAGADEGVMEAEVEIPLIVADSDVANTGVDNSVLAVAIAEVAEV